MENQGWEGVIRDDSEEGGEQEGGWNLRLEG